MRQIFARAQNGGLRRAAWRALGRLALGSSLAVSGGCGRIGLELLELDGGDGEDSASDGALALEDVGQACTRDDDGDGICTALDNCPRARNVDQADLDGDGLGDVCDDDLDGDGGPTVQGPCPSGSPNDSDGDGVCDNLDRCALGDDRLDADRDGAPDACDSCPNSAAGDTDFDGICDEVDACPGADDRIDSDGDRSPDACDRCPAEPSKAALDICGCARTPSSPIGHWRFDETMGAVASDARGSHPGALINPGNMPWTAGVHGNALSFAGRDAYVDVGALSSPARSVALWVRPGSFTAMGGETAWSSPSANGSRDRGWSNPTAAYASDNQRTNAFGGDGHDWYGFHLNVPSAASVPGIAVQVELRNANLSVSIDVDLSWNGGQSYTQPQRLLPVLADQYYQFGGSTDAWGRSWQGSQLTDANFRVRLTKTGLPSNPLTDGVDHIRVRAYYSFATPAGRRIFGASPDAQVGFAGQAITTSGWPAGTVVFVDGTAGGPVLDGNWHHVVVSSPADVEFSAFQVGGIFSSPPSFQGAIDDVRVFAETLEPGQAAALFAESACGQ